MNSNILKIHLDILDSKRVELLKQLTPLAKGFILGGGTALALQMGHRKSFDFDFFSHSQIPQSLLETLSRNLNIHTVSVDTINELTFFTREEVKITFLCYPFDNAFEPVESENGLLVFSVKDIAIKKAHTIGRRGEYRDYFDLYTILKNDIISLHEIIVKAQEIYEGAFEEKMFLQQLVYFDDLLDFSIIPTGEDQLPDQLQVKQFFEEIVGHYIASKQ
jgi:predicted nucleotidyltransferase component of viral defense system